MNETKLELIEKYAGTIGLKLSPKHNKEVKDFLIEAMNTIQQDMATKLLAKGFGGGNWRRIINQIRDIS